MRKDVLTPGMRNPISMAISNIRWKACVLAPFYVVGNIRYPAQLNPCYFLMSSTSYLSEYFMINEDILPCQLLGIGSKNNCGEKDIGKYFGQCIIQVPN